MKKQFWYMIETTRVDGSKRLTGISGSPGTPFKSYAPALKTAKKIAKELDVTRAEVVFYQLVEQCRQITFKDEE